MSKVVNTAAIAIFIIAILICGLFIAQFFSYHAVSLEGFLEILKLPSYLNNFNQFRLHIDSIGEHIFALSMALTGIILILCSIGIYKRNRYILWLFLVIDFLFVLFFLWLILAMPWTSIIESVIVVVGELIFVLIFILLLLKKSRIQFKPHKKAGGLFWSASVLLLVAIFLPSYSIYSFRWMEDHYLAKRHHLKTVKIGMNQDKVSKLCGQAHIKIYLYKEGENVLAVPIDNGKVLADYCSQVVFNGKQVKLNPSFNINLTKKPDYIGWRYFHFVSVDAEHAGIFGANSLTDIFFKDNHVIAVQEGFE